MPRHRKPANDISTPYWKLRALVVDFITANRNLNEHTAHERRHGKDDKKRNSLMLQKTEKYVALEEYINQNK